MNRREAIEKTALALGYALSAPALAGILKGCKPSPGLSYTPVFLTQPQALIIGEVSEIMIPKTDTPGAKEAGVPSFIDVMMKEVYSKEEQDRFVQGIADFDKDASATYGSAFIDCEFSKQAELVTKHHDAALQQSMTPGQPQPFILLVKELTLLGFFTSEAGATQVLQYNPVPGPYRGCVPLAEVGKTWAT